MGHWHNTMLLLVISLAILHVSHAHSEPSDYLHMHSCIRKALGLPPLTWDPALAQRAEKWAAQRTDCKLIHSPGGGENMGKGPDLSGRWAVQMWVDERRNYDYNKNECIHMCGHYTQVVWKDTQRLGCARIKCDPPEEDYYVVVCNYDPPGNYPGVWPY
ncbi:pathogenesis-related leaf protein 4-like [Cynara cardunculus var. scolymus]|uniref:pathogenesis-related leaf protein 4-like n=1 Tax=Cynara cardunculus var. scolymus TaxID=59895 RepID=UPI000D628B26|nr:pathogenesis-related leaf protein 4-like [Cynara cardunculus var. scolymus]